MKKILLVTLLFVLFALVVSTGSQGQLSTDNNDVIREYTRDGVLMKKILCEAGTTTISMYKKGDSVLEIITTEGGNGHAFYVIPEDTEKNLPGQYFMMRRTSFKITEMKEEEWLSSVRKFAPNFFNYFTEQPSDCFIAEEKRGV